MVTDNNNEFRVIKVVDRAIEIDFQNGRKLRLEDCWLRDQCRCSSCYHADTFQRAQHIIDIPDVFIGRIQYDNSSLHVFWEDDHKSEFTSDFLAQFDYNTWSEERKRKPVLWQEPAVANKVAKVSASEFLKSIKGAQTVFSSLLDYGVALIDGVEPTSLATEKICEALGGVQHTIFGGMWEFTTRADHADTAYTNLPLAVHNDNTYFTEAAGLQVLHCIEHSNGTGGDTLLVDGFFGASQMKEDHPKDFDFLTTFDVEAEYIEEGHHHRFSAPVIRVDKDNNIVQVRYNMYDRSAMAFANEEQCRTYYRSLRNLAKYYQDPVNQWQFKLKPGVVMVMDNFRVLHGRTAFSGTRRVCGSYVSRSDWLEKARILKLIN